MTGRWRRAWPRIKQALWIALAVAVLGLIGWRAREIDWSEVLTALRALPLTTVALGAVIAVAAYAAYISYDLLARRYTVTGSASVGRRRSRESVSRSI